MGLLAEYALTPDVLDSTSYSGDEVCDLRLQVLKERLLSSGLVRNLRDGEWAKQFLGDHRPWHRRGKELLKKLATQKRLVPSAAALTTTPNTDLEWCEEALASHNMVSLDGIITSNTIAVDHKANAFVASIEKLSGAPWWAGQSQSMRIGRTLEDYLTALNLVLRHANSIMFIDPHIDLALPRYKDFISLLQVAGARSLRPQIEIHRVCYRGSGANRQFSGMDEFEADFRRELKPLVEYTGLTVECYIWDDFHDRYMISNLVGISLPYGFDTTAAPNSTTTWTRLGRNDRDDIQREFDPASNRHKLKRRFLVSS